MKYIYYVLWQWSMAIYGPMSFKEAMRAKEKATTPVVILKMVVDEQGKEVK